jgi:hypothetical protein
MFHRRSLIRLLCMVGLALFLFDSAASDAVAQRRRTPPRPPRIGRVHYYVVQARNPLWRAVGVVPTRQAALITKATLARRGYSVRVRRNSTGNFVVFSRMMHWHAVGMYTTRPLANHAVLILRQRALQGRVIAAK